ncbi:hypothetical protein HK102_006568, partial [Quaeritorhiza haematococci]
MADPITLVISVVILYLFFKYVLGTGQQQANPAARNNAAFTTGRGTTSAAPARPLYRVSPDKVDTVLAMFPHFPRATIEADLARTGSVELTCENILSGALVP